MVCGASAAGLGLVVGGWPGCDELELPYGQPRHSLGDPSERQTQTSGAESLETSSGLSLEPLRKLSQTGHLQALSGGRVLF